MTTKFDAKIRSKNTNVNDDNGRLEERAKLLRGIERREYDETTLRRSESRDGERNFYHQTNFSMKYGLAEGQGDVN